MCCLYFNNLIKKAVKISDIRNEIDLIVKSNNNNIIITFKDHGQGISENDKKKAFGMFQELTARPTSGETSNELSLSIVKALVEN